MFFLFFFWQILTTVPDTIAASPEAGLQKLVLSCLADMNALAQSDLDDEYYRDVLSAVAKPNRTKTCLRLLHELFVLSRAGNWPLERFVHPDLTERAAGLMVSNSLCFVYFALAFTSMS